MTTTSPSYTTSSVKRRKRWPWVLAGLLLIGGIGTGVILKNRQAQATTTTQMATTATATQGSLRVSVSGPGTLSAPNSVTVSTTQGGTVGNLPNVGDQVTRGQLITTLTNDTVTSNLQNAQLNLQKAQASLASTLTSNASTEANRQSSVVQAQNNVLQAQQAVSDAQRTLNAQQQLKAIGAASQQALADAQSAYSKAAVNLRIAQDSLSSAQLQRSTGLANDQQNAHNAQVAVEQAQVSLNTAQKAVTQLKVYAPMSGVISAVNVTPGTNLNLNASGAALVSILDDRTLYLPAQIDETQIGGVKVGQDAEVTLDAIEGQTFRGKVITVSPSGTQSNGIAVFTATVKLSNPDHQLRSGMTAQAEIIQSEDQGLIIPAKAVQTTRGRSYVQIPAPANNADGVPVGQPMRVRVKTGATDGTDIIVTEGLQAGQEVIVVGAKKSSTSSSGTSRNTQGGFGGPPPGGF